MLLEIAAMFEELPPGWTKEALVAKLQQFQGWTNRTGAGLWSPPDVAHDNWMPLSDLLIPSTNAVGYALEILMQIIISNSCSRIDEQKRYTLQLNSLPWETQAWGRGDWIDCYDGLIFGIWSTLDSQKRPDDLMGYVNSCEQHFRLLWGNPLLKLRLAAARQRILSSH